MCYFNDSGPTDLLLTRRFPVCDTARYADVSCTNPDDLGHVQQIYVDDGALGGFGELEYHSPAIASDGEQSVTDCSEVWACAGEEAGEAMTSSG